MKTIHRTSILTFIIIVAFWEFMAGVFRVDPWILPSPARIVQSLWQVRQLLWLHSIQTLTEALLGLGIAIVFGILFALIIEWSQHARQTFYPILVASQTIPIVAVAPLLVVWFGFGLLPKVLVVALVCFFPITVSLVDGFRLVDRNMLRLLRIMGATKVQIFSMVKIPASLPAFFSGLRIAGTYAVLAAVISEWLGASKGLGVFLTRSSKSYLTDRVFATIIVIAVLSLFVFISIEIVARRVIPWHYRKANV